MSQRADIRHYITNLLKNNIPIENRVYANRINSPIFLEQLPCICVYFEDEQVEMISGSQFRVKEYQKLLTIAITIVVEDIVVNEDNIDESSKGEDYLDYLSEQVERVLFFDWRLARNLDDFDEEQHTNGLTFGSRLLNTTLYDVETESDRRIIAQTIRFLYPYNVAGYLDLRYKDFESFYAAIIRVGSDENTTDRELLEMENNL